jgi:hypothetical protein
MKAKNWDMGHIDPEQCSANLGSPTHSYWVLKLRWASAKQTNEQTKRD